MWLNSSFASIFNNGLLHYYHRSSSLDLCNQNPCGGERGEWELGVVCLDLGSVLMASIAALFTPYCISRLGS